MKLNYDEPLSNFAFNFKLRRYVWGMRRAELLIASNANVGGPTTAGPCELKVLKPVLKVPGGCSA